ncbi:MAG TPA: ATP synthase F1 subunit delta [Bdellovibrionales bacterium]|nr:ATP synthase F1 subunit delta [Bdellovibrionales bacterium]
MKASGLGQRYAKALFELAVDNRTQEKVFNDLRELDRMFSADKETHEFLISPMVSADERVKVLEAALANKGASKEVVDLMLLLARKGRFTIFHEIVLAFQNEIDASNGVCRGTVRSAVALGQPERERLEATVERVLKKKVILVYKVDPTVIGGLVAQVGSYTFDDSISSHLRRMNEELKRRTV